LFIGPRIPYESILRVGFCVVLCRRL
jgi:hypothetical protein